MKPRLTIVFALAPLALMALLTVCDASPVGVPGPLPRDPLPGGPEIVGEAMRQQCTDGLAGVFDEQKVRELDVRCE